MVVEFRVVVVEVVRRVGFGIDFESRVDRVFR